MNSSRRTLWTWIPSLYFTGGIPFVMITTVATVFFKRMGMDNAEIAFYTGGLLFPWAVRPLWESLILKYPYHRKWLLFSQFTIAASLACIALSLKTRYTFAWVLFFFLVTAVCNAIHDTTGKSIYEDISKEDQTSFIGVRSKFYSISLIVGQGIILMAAGVLETFYRDIPKAWAMIFTLASVLFLALSLYHLYSLPDIPLSGSREDIRHKEREERMPLSFNRGFVFILLFLLFFNLPKALLSKVSLFFFIDPAAQNGLALSLPQIGFGQGTIGTIGMVIGGILGKNALLSGGLGKWKWLMCMSFSIPNILFLYLGESLPSHFGLICSIIFIEQMGYGFGIAAYFFYITQYLQHHKSRSIQNVLYSGMAVSLMIPGMISGWLQTYMGYTPFFVLTLICTLPTILLTFFLKEDSAHKSL